MNEAQALAHAALLKKLPVRPVAGRDMQDEVVNRQENRGRPILVKGKRYENATEAAKAIGCSRSQITKLLLSGRAEYL